MPDSKRKYYIQNVVFFIGIFILLINDHYLKLQFSGWFTGKLSDFVGLFVFPMFLSFLFTDKIKTNVILTGVSFIFWKSPYSQPLIDAYNQIALIETTRVVDYSDLLALFSLPLSFVFIKRINEFKGLWLEFNLKPIFLILPVILIFMATSPPYYYKYSFSNGELNCFRCTKVLKLNKLEILELLKEYDYSVTIDKSIVGNYYSENYFKDSLEKNVYYKIDEIVMGNDTITNFQFALEEISNKKTKIWINSMDISEEITDNKVEIKLRKYYRSLIKMHLKQLIKQKAKS
jgi:hypothetical protein